MVELSVYILLPYPALPLIPTESEIPSRQVLTAIGFAACACVGELHSVLVHAPANSHGIVALGRLVESLDVAVRCVGS